MFTGYIEDPLKCNYNGTAFRGSLIYDPQSCCFPSPSLWLYWSMYLILLTCWGKEKTAWRYCFYGFSRENGQSLLNIRPFKKKKTIKSGQVFYLREMASLRTISAVVWIPNFINESEFFSLNINIQQLFEHPFENRPVSIPVFSNIYASTCLIYHFLQIHHWRYCNILV